jgi:hypothetical protein
MAVPPRKISWSSTVTSWILSDAPEPGSLTVPFLCEEWSILEVVTWGDFWRALFNHALRTTRVLFPQARLRFVADAVLDDQKIYRWIASVKGEFIIRAYHSRAVEVYNESLDRWEKEALHIASTKKTAWMSKSCVCGPWNACVVSLSCS